MLLYISGPYTGEIEQNIKEARKVAIEVWEKGHAVICPHTNTSHFETDCKLGYDDYIKGDLIILARCDGIVMTKQWMQSNGAVVEHQFAQDNKIPVWYYPEIPPLHPTELRCPKQVEGFMNTIMSMYRIHLAKNADYCVDPSTKVLDKTLRWKPISSVKEGDVLVGFDEFAHLGNKRRMFRPSVIESVSQVTLPSYCLYMEDGTKLISSSKHPWLVKSGATSRWLSTEALNPADIYPSNTSKIIRMLDVWEDCKTYDDGYLAAALDGEGWLSQIPNYRHGGGECFRLGFSQRKNKMLDYVLSILDNRKLTYTVRLHQATEQLRFCKTPKINLIRLIGEIRPKRLIAGLNLNLGMANQHPIRLLHKEFIGEYELVSIQTSTKTYIAEGFGSHNSPANILATGEIGLTTRLWDKVARLMNLTGFRFQVIPEPMDVPKEPKHESIDDTLSDAAVYSVIGQLLRKGVWGQ